MARAIVSVDIENFAPLTRAFREAPANAREAARRAVNLAAERGRTLGAAAMRKQINLTPGYLSDRLSVTKRATLSDLSADVTGRDRPTSLARFAVNRGDAKKRLPGRLKIKPNGTARLARGTFLVPLKKGRAESGNVGLAIRLPLGGQVRGRKRGKAGLVPFGKAGKTTRAYLLYGPSIDQVFDKTRDQIAPGVGRALELEALRQLRVLGVTRG